MWIIEIDLFPPPIRGQYKGGAVFFPRIPRLIQIVLPGRWRFASTGGGHSLQSALEHGSGFFGGDRAAGLVVSGRGHLLEPREGLAAVL